MEIRYNARELLETFFNLVLLELYAGWESAITLGGSSRHFLT
jgi:hypothetical protein